LHHSWEFIITLDESSFYLSTDHEQIWLRIEEQLPEKPRHAIHDPKTMATIPWNSLEFHLLEELPKGNKFIAEYYRVNIFTEFLRLRQPVDGRRLILHADNARPHTAQNAELFPRKSALLRCTPAVLI
jgi:hypothetical protein